MKKNPITIASLLLACLSVTSCHKEEYGCAYPYYYRPFGLAFVGYDSVAIAQLVLETYTKNTNYTQLLSSDTLLGVSLEQRLDTIFRNGHWPFFEIKADSDYKVKIVNTGESFTIDSIQTGPATYSWNSATPCSPGAGQPRIMGYKSFRVNGVPQHPEMYFTNNFVYYIVR